MSFLSTAGIVGSKVSGMVNKVSSIRGYADTFINKWILKPKGMRGINGFVFDGVIEDTVQLSSEITDHYVESNTFINDHVAIRPARIILKGYIGELVYNTNPSGVLGFLNTAQNLLTTVPAYLGKYTPKGIQDIQKAIVKGTSFVNKIDNYIARAKNIVGLFSGGAADTKQQEAYERLKGLWIGRVLCSVETPYEYFEDCMMIESLAFRQGETDKYRTDIIVTLKEVRFAQVSANPVSKLNTAGRALHQRLDPIDNGKSKGTETTWTDKFTIGKRINGKLSL